MAFKAHSLPRYLSVEQDRIEKIAAAAGLDFFPVVFEMLAYDQMNEVASYSGFPVRYPHWRFGMEYERLSKSYEYGLSKIYEMVINNNPSFAYLLEGNSLTDQKMVMCHVYGHVDFFKNNFSFRGTDLDATGDVVDPIRRLEGGYDPNRKWIDKMANHGAAVRRIVDRHGIAKVEEFIDVCLSLENLIDAHSRFVVRNREEVVEEEPNEIVVPRLRAKDYMEEFINPEAYIAEQKQVLTDERERKKTRFPGVNTQDVLAFLADHAPLERWERTVLSIIRDEAYYFVPQMQTKVLNEGWACVAADTLTFTDAGVVTMKALVGGAGRQVSDGKYRRHVYDNHVIRKHATITVRTRRGLRLCGSTNHRVLAADGVTWKRLDELAVGDRVAISGGQGLWADEPVAVDWKPRAVTTLDSAAEAAGVSVSTVLRHRAGSRTCRAAAIDAALDAYVEPNEMGRVIRSRRPVKLPSEVTAELGRFLGYLVGDGHISRKKRQLGLTTGDEIQAVEFLLVARRLFDVPVSMRLDEAGGSSRWRVITHSETLSDFLVDGLGLTHGPSARDKAIPEAVLRSPEPIVREFLRAYFDCDAYAGPSGVILSSSSRKLIEQCQLLLLNYGILSRTLPQPKDIWQLHVKGASAARFAEKVGFGLDRKQRALDAYVDGHHWFKAERWDDEVVSIEAGRADVYDISVAETHRYVAQGFVNHNSYWHSRLMTEQVADWGDIVEYAENNAGVMATSNGRLNPYKLGVELLRNIEERWDRGQFGREWEECDDLDQKRGWDLRLGLGRQKIFEVRSLYNDVTFIDEFLTEEFAIEQGLYTYNYSGRNERFEIESREFRKVKEKLLGQLTNFGNPIIIVEEGNFENRGELLLRHDHRGVDLRQDYARETMRSLVRIWRRPVCLATLVEGKRTLLRFDGTEFSAKPDAP